MHPIEREEHAKAAREIIASGQFTRGIALLIGIVLSTLVVIGLAIYGAVRLIFG